MQSQFEMNVYKYQCYLAIPVIATVNLIREPTHVLGMDVFSFLEELGEGFMVIFVRSFVISYSISDCIELAVFCGVFLIRCIL